MLGDGHRRGVVAVLVAEQAAARVARVAPGGAAVGGAADHHPAVQPPAVAVAVVGADQVQVTPMHEQLRPDLAVHLGNALPRLPAVA